MYSEMSSGSTGRVLAPQSKLLVYSAIKESHTIYLPYPSWIPWDPTFWKRNEFSAILGCFANEKTCFLDRGIKVQPHRLCLGHRDLD